MPLDIGWLAEQRMRDAVRRGVLDHLPGEGQPLGPDPLEGLTGEALREALLMRTLGAVPVEVTAMRELAELQSAARAATGEARVAAVQAFHDAQLKLVILFETSGRGHLARQVSSLTLG